MKEFAELLSDLDNTRSTNQKIILLDNYMQAAESVSVSVGIWLLLGNKTKSFVASKELKAIVYEYLKIADWLFDESYQSVGDLAETIALLFRDNPVFNDTSPNKPETLEQLFEKISELRAVSPELKKEFILTFLSNSDFWQRFSFIKILTGGFRLGVSKNIIIKACAKRFNTEESAAAAILTGSWDPMQQSIAQLFSCSPSVQHISRPYPFLLAYSLEPDSLKLMQCNDYLAEYKWDGIRAQLIKRNNQIYLWSRGEELLNLYFPDIIEFHQSLPDGTVLDGEILAYNRKPLGFSELQRRLGRLNPSINLQKQIPCIFMAYDLLEIDYKDIRNTALSERKNLLDLLQKKSLQELQISPTYEIESWDKAFEYRSRSSELLAEGLMIKKKDSVYAAGRKRGLWLKWKLDPFSIDAVLVYAQKGHGRRANLYSDYTFAVWNDNQLVTFAKAYSGLTDKEIAEVDSFVKRNTKEKFGPVRTIKPELVFELAFEAIQSSKRHKCGLAVRFPRIVRWRKDKRPEQADKIEDLRKLIAAKAK